MHRFHSAKPIGNFLGFHFALNFLVNIVSDCFSDVFILSLRYRDAKKSIPKDTIGQLFSLDFLHYIWNSEMVSSRDARICNDLPTDAKSNITAS